MSMLRPLATLTGALLVRSGNAALAGWAMPAAVPLAPPAPAASAGRRHGPEGLRFAEKGKARPSIMTLDDEAALRPDMEVRVSFRIDAERHRRLRLAALRQGRSRQQLLVGALDAYLEGAAALAGAGNS